MKKYVWLPLILLAVLGSAATSTKAQSTYVRANVPFDFIVGDKPLPAGKITVRFVSASDLGPLAISNNDKGSHAIRLAHILSSSNSIKRGKLVFNKYGNRYYLAQVWIPGAEALAFTKSKSERALARETMLSKNITSEVVTVIADLQ